MRRCWLFVQTLHLCVQAMANMNSNGNDLQAVYDIVKEGRGQPEVILQRLIQTIKQRPQPVAGLPTRNLQPRVDVPQLLSNNSAFKEWGLHSQMQKMKTGEGENILFPGCMPPSNLSSKFAPSVSRPKKFFPYSRPPSNTQKQFAQGFVPYAVSSQHNPRVTAATPPQRQQLLQQNFKQQTRDCQKVCDFSWFLSHPYYIAKYKAPKRRRSKKKGLKRRIDNQGAGNRMLIKRQRIKTCEGLEKLAEIAIAELQEADVCQKVQKEISFGYQQDPTKLDTKDDFPEPKNFAFNNSTGNFEDQMKILQKMKNIFNSNQFGIQNTSQNNIISNLQENPIIPSSISERINDNQFLHKKQPNFQNNNKDEHNLNKKKFNNNNNNNNKQVLINEAIKNLLDFSKHSEDLIQLENRAEKLMGTQTDISMRYKNLNQRYENLNDQMQQMKGSMESKFSNIEFQVVQSNKQLMQILQQQSMSQNQRKQTVEWLQSMLASIANKQQTY
eukprot:TRINITY_DN1561_c0_g4_i4.p1 TRINITY_DN1561_c0_g4~~TRINITY_DN1561_c0_g4_i4.p1  ORF type:complete len:498 (-),score=54.10 TRINITY_DN1561_c0_g4_i4:559-2052(-)